jgi:3-oxoacyl-[acyl-carrier-protein] synthase-1
MPRLVAADQSGLTARDDLVPGRRLIVGEVHAKLPALPPPLHRYTCRTNQLALAALRQIEGPLREVMADTPADRVAVVMGTSTSGVASAEHALAHRGPGGALDPDFDCVQLEQGGVAEFVAAVTGASGPAYTLSTACSSSAKALASARALLALGLCDAVVAGGADSLCGLTTNGFFTRCRPSPLTVQPVQRQPRRPHARGRRRHVPAHPGPRRHPAGRRRGQRRVSHVGARSCRHRRRDGDAGGAAGRRDAGRRGELPEPARTGTPLNDAMESAAVHRIFGATLSCSSTKPLVGHTLGAAGALELAFCWMMLAHWRAGALPLLPHCWDGQADPALPPLRFARVGDALALNSRALVMSNSFGFGGNNCALLLGADER